MVAYERWLHLEVRLNIGPLGSLEVSLALSVLYYFFFFFEKSNNHNYTLLLFLSFLSLFLCFSILLFFFRTNLAHFGIIPVITENKGIIIKHLFLSGFVFDSTR